MLRLVVAVLAVLASDSICRAHGECASQTQNVVVVYDLSAPSADINAARQLAGTLLSGSSQQFWVAVLTYRPTSTVTMLTNFTTSRLVQESIAQGGVAGVPVTGAAGVGLGQALVAAGLLLESASVRSGAKIVVFPSSGSITAGAMSAAQALKAEGHTILASSSFTRSQALVSLPLRDNFFAVAYLNRALMSIRGDAAWAGTCLATAGYHLLTWDTTQLSLSGVQGEFYMAYSNNGGLTVQIRIAPCTATNGCPGIVGVAFTDGTATVQVRRRITADESPQSLVSVNGGAFTASPSSTMSLVTLQRGVAGDGLEHNLDLLQANLGSSSQQTIQVWLGWQMHVRIDSVAAYGQILGLCGLFDGCPSTDLYTRSGTRVRDVSPFAESWRVPLPESLFTSIEDAMFTGGTQATVWPQGALVASGDAASACSTMSGTFQSLCLSESSGTNAPYYASTIEDVHDLDCYVYCAGGLPPLGGAQTCLPLCTNPLDQAARPATTPLDTYDAGNLPPVNLAQVDAQTTVVQMPLGLAGNYTFRSNLANAMCQQEPVNVTGK
ncbi:VWFD domain-containing protein [Plasmodiophora brassicae]|uniref:VWFD domain-containing protein n=1 Tax=Plasmodiophora brassicae TaxID=37360 RepID=A0A0G4IQY2_PLABS|nr:hypothetical protein PBRA_000980 [Plasmodiophora brassicae]